MKSKIILLIFFSTALTSCENSEINVSGDFMFIAEFLTTITAGGVVGITERTFEVGEIYKGTDHGNKTITIRIAGHSELNENCPNSWCYQEYLEVPRKYLKLIEK